MKDIKQKINESREIQISCAFNDLIDENGLPISCTLLVDSKYAKQVSEFGTKEEGNIFAHFCDENENICY